MRLVEYFIFLLLFISSLYGITPYNEKTDDFEAVVTYEVINNSNTFEYHYTLKYDAKNKRDLVIISFDFPPGSLSGDEFLQATGKADRNIEWIGDVMGGTVKESLIFSSK